MKKLILLLLFTAITFAQNPTKNAGGFYAGTTTMNASAIGQFDSTAKGFLFPRMTTIQRDLIVAPSTSLLIFNVTDNVYQYFNGATWVNVTAGLSIDELDAIRDANTPSSSNPFATISDLSALPTPTLATVTSAGAITPTPIQVQSATTGDLSVMNPDDFELYHGTNGKRAYLTTNHISFGRNYGVDYYNLIPPATLTTTRNVSFPDKSGTVAFTSDIPSAVSVDPLEFNTTDKTVWNNGKGNIATNTSFGENALKNNTTGNKNIAFGESSLFNNTTGIGNVAIGKSAMSNSTSSSNNIAIGDSSLQNNSGSYNVAIGTQAISLGSGSYNMGIGHWALRFLTSGSENIALGFQVLSENSSGSGNVGVGSLSLYSNTTGSNNIGVGGGTLYSVTSGNSNTGIGQGVLNAISTGVGNVGLGYAAGSFVNGGDYNYLSNNSVFIGKDTKALANNQTNQIVIGHNAIGEGSNTTTIGNSSTISTKLFGALKDTSGDVGTSGQVLSSTVTGTNWITPATGGEPDAMHLYNTETVTGNKTFTPAGNTTTAITVNSEVSETGIQINAATGSVGLKVLPTSTSIGINVTGVTTSANALVEIINPSTTSGGTGLYVGASGASSQPLILANGSSTSTGKIFSGRSNYTETSSIDKAGVITGTQIVKSGGTSSQLLAANGTVVTAGTNISISGGTISSTAGITDGDKGDITVGGTGTTLTIDNSAVTLAKLSATGTPSVSNFLRGDNTWAVADNTIKNQITTVSSVFEGEIILSYSTGTKRYDILFNGAQTSIGEYVSGVFVEQVTFNTDAPTSNTILIGTDLYFVYKASGVSYLGKIDTTIPFAVVPTALTLNLGNSYRIAYNSASDVILIFYGTNETNYTIYDLNTDSEIFTDIVNPTYEVKAVSFSLLTSFSYLIVSNDTLYYLDDYYNLSSSIPLSSYGTFSNTIQLFENTLFTDNSERLFLGLSAPTIDGKNCGLIFNKTNNSITTYAMLPTTALATFGDEFLYSVSDKFLEKIDVVKLIDDGLTSSYSEVFTHSYATPDFLANDGTNLYIHSVADFYKVNYTYLEQGVVTAKELETDRQSLQKQLNELLASQAKVKARTIYQGFTTITGVTTPTIAISKLIPANTYDVIDGFEIIVTIRKSTTAGAVNYNLYHATTINGTTNAIASAVQLSTTNKSGGYSRILNLSGGSAYNAQAPTSTSLTPYVASSGVAGTTTLNPTVDNYITLQISGLTVVSETSDVTLSIRPLK